MKEIYSRIPFETILYATDGDLDAIERIKSHFRPYLIKCSLRPMIDDLGNSHMILDETLFGRLETRLLTKILSFEIE
ncbi:helix-turn-helix domain-containing protein [Enterococcus olivae]